MVIIFSSDSDDRRGPPRDNRRDNRNDKRDFNRDREYQR